MSMEITTKNMPSAVDAYVNQVQAAKQTPAASPAADKPAQTGDTVSLSKEARDVQAAEDKLQSTPDVRDEKVADIQNRLKNGTYRVDGDKIAMNMLKESFFNESA